MFDEYFKEIKENEIRKWRPQTQSVAVGIIDSFLDSDMKMAEIDVSKLPEPEPKEGTSPRSTKQDGFASSFYAWKKKTSTKEALSQKGIDILIIRKGERIALKKIPRKK